MATSDAEPLGGSGPINSRLAVLQKTSCIAGRAFMMARVGGKLSLMNSPESSSLGHFGRLWPGTACESRLNRSGDRLFELPSQERFVLDAPTPGDRPVYPDLRCLISQRSTLNKPLNHKLICPDPHPNSTTRARAQSQPFTSNQDWINFTQKRRANCAAAQKSRIRPVFTTAASLPPNSPPSPPTLRRRLPWLATHHRPRDLGSRRQKHHCAPPRDSICRRRQMAPQPTRPTPSSAANSDSRPTRR